MANELVPSTPARGSFLAALTGAARADRRNRRAQRPWYLVSAGSGTVFLAAHERTGRSYRLPARDEAEAEALVEGLNRASLNITA
jgi:hypothetical protein